MNATNSWRSTFTFGPLLMLCITGCDEDPSQDEAMSYDCTAEITSQSQHRAVNLQGRSHQGVDLQGLDFQGLEFQGLEFQGLEFQGLHLQGVDLQGINVHGTSLDGSGGFSVTRPPTSGPRLEGSKIVMPDPNQSPVGAELLATTELGELMLLRVEQVALDTSSNIHMYNLSLHGQNLCANGEPGVFVPGVWHTDGSRSHSFEAAGRAFAASFSCPSGVLAKCARWGYHPAEVGTEIHQACTRMARADYCGNGQSHTREQTEIDLFDAWGIQQSEGGPEFLFEAGWGVEGAVCAHRPRFDTVHVVDGPQLPSCWEELPDCSSWQHARNYGAVLGNRSQQANRYMCDQ